MRHAIAFQRGKITGRAGSPLILCVTASLMCAIAAAATPSADWPMFIGNGSRTPPKQGIALIDDLNAMRTAWELHHHMGVGKGLYPGTLRTARTMGIEPFYGGTASPIVANGTVYVAYYRPDGKVRAAAEPWRTVGDPKSLLPSWFFSVTADDILLAVDARTGKVKWEAVEKGAGLNRLGHKRGHWCVSPAYADGRVFSMGTTGLLRAYDAKTGEKLWETPTSPDIEALKKEYLQKKKLCWHASEGSSLIVAEGVVVVCRQSLLGIDARTGQRRWRVEGRIESRSGTPTLWRHEGREYLLANSETGDLRLIDPRDGRVVWHIDGLGTTLGTLSVAGDFVVLNVGSRHGEGKHRHGLFGAWRLSLAGPKKLWTLPDKEGYWHEWKMDAGPSKKVALQDGRAYIAIYHSKKPDGIRPPVTLLVVGLEGGRILSEQETGRGSQPYVFEDRMLIYHDRHHSDPVTASFWTADVRPRRLTGEVKFPHVAITAYEVPIQWPYVDGFLYCRSLKGLICYDLRKPTAKDNARTLHFLIPTALTSRRTDMQVMLCERNGRLTHGGFGDARRLHAIDVSPVRWDGRRLSGTLSIDVEGNRRSEAYEVDATLADDGTLNGTVKTGVATFAKPISLSGTVWAIERQPAWMPECTHVLSLDEASCRADGSRKRLLLFFTVEKGRLTRVEGFAARTTKGRPVVDARGLTLEKGRLAGKVVVRFRPDPWSAPLAEQGSSAAARYSLDCKLVQAGEAGSYTSTYGVAWSRTGRLHGKIESMAVAAQTMKPSTRPSSGQP